MSWFMIDIEADGPIPGDFSMIEIGAVLIENGLKKVFYGNLKPISSKWVPDALKVTGYTREQTLEFNDPLEIMDTFEDWLLENNKKSSPKFISDNNGFDWMFCCWYFHHFLGRNPFGHSSTNLGSLYKGIRGNMFDNFKHLRRTKHTHNPVDDSRGNAEALLRMVDNGFILE